jgi:Baseplate J-like protein
MTTPAIPLRNRLGLVVTSTVVNGIDFIELKQVDATTLYVHFLNFVSMAGPTVNAAISGGDRIQGITLRAIKNADWMVDASGRPVLRLYASKPGDFSLYTITITGAPLDPMYQSATFSFKALCPTEFDCRTEPDCCRPDDPPLPAIDYLAKDFQSFKIALTEFSAQRYPAWQEQSEADFGAMFMETLCAVADELSYLQDRVAAESTLLSATQRRSLVSMARLVDYEPQPTISATTTVQCDVVGTTVPAGTLVSATGPDGVEVPFEIGAGLSDETQYAVSTKWNSGQIVPYWLDDSQRCLSCGATGMWLVGQDYDFVTPTPETPGTALLIQTDLPGESIREIVHVTSVRFDEDQIYETGLLPTMLTYITWSAAEALQRDHDLAATQVSGNLLPATQGRRYSESFAVGTAPAGASAMPLAVVRMGPNGTPDSPNWIVRYPLSRSSVQPAVLVPQGRLTWLTPAPGADGSAIDPDIAMPLPELNVSRRLPDAQGYLFSTSLLDVAATDWAYTVDPAAWRVVDSDATGSATQWEYDGDGGDTLRFGDGTFGEAPVQGDVFDVLYRIGLGAAGNVAAGAISIVPPASTGYLSGVRNPFAVTSGADQETAQHIARMAPQAFRAVQYRAVLAKDYQAAAETLPWVLRAGTSFRWTGSWLTVFTTADPEGTGWATETEQIGLIDLLNRRRLAGYESYAPPPIYVSIDLEITVCVEAQVIGSDVEARILSRLADATASDGTEGFFYADCFTFGTPLYRSQLETAIQTVTGVNGVLDVQYRQRGASNVFQELPDILSLGSMQILRVENNPDYPERGTIRVFAEGGR